MCTLAETGLIEVTGRNYLTGNQYVLSARATDYIDKWRAQRVPAVEPTGWAAVDSAVATLRTRLGSAATPNDYKAVGHECVTVLEALGRAVFDPARHLPSGEPVPATNDAKRRLDLFVRIVARGERFAHVRKIITEAYAQGHEIKHRTQPDRLDATVSADAVLLIVTIVRHLADWEPRGDP
jgi:hypothetical protein